MSKGRSGIFTDTIGDKIPEGRTLTESPMTPQLMYAFVGAWAAQKADELTQLSKRQRNSFNTACIVYDERTGKTYFGINNGIAKKGTPKNPVLFGKGGILPSTKQDKYEIGNCAEVDAVNNALNDGARLQDLHMLTIHTTDRNFAKPKCACGNCTYTFKGKVKANYTGWKGEDQ